MFTILYATAWLSNAHDVDSVILVVTFILSLLRIQTLLSINKTLLMNTHIQIEYTVIY